jgi:hypothetical protein
MQNVVQWLERQNFSYLFTLVHLGAHFGLSAGWGPVFRVGRNPAVRLFLGRKITDLGDGAISSTYGNGPTTVLDHLRMEFWFLAHPKNTRLWRNGSIPNSPTQSKLIRWPRESLVLVLASLPVFPD